jgi:hypothetical protein
LGISQPEEAATATTPSNAKRTCERMERNRLVFTLN